MRQLDEENSIQREEKLGGFFRVSFSLNSFQTLQREL